MHRKSLLLVALLFPVIILASWVGYIQYYINNAGEITIRAEGFDPRSLISGHYIRLRLNWQATDCTQFDDNLCHPSRFDSVYNFYLPEEDAAYIDRQIWKSGNTLKIDLVFAYPENKQPHLKRMLIDGKDWPKWIKEHQFPSGI